MRERLPDPLHCSVCKSVELVLVVQSSEDESFKSHFGEQVLICGRVAEGVDMPPYSRNILKFLEQELMALSHVFNDIQIIRTCLVVHRPACIHKLELPIFDVLFDSCPHFLSLITPPLRKEGHFYLHERPLRVLFKLPHDRSDGHLHVSCLDIIPGPCVVLVYCLEPPHVVVGMGYYVDCGLTKAGQPKSEQ